MRTLLHVQYMYNLSLLLIQIIIGKFDIFSPSVEHFDLERLRLSDAFEDARASFDLQLHGVLELRVLTALHHFALALLRRFLQGSLTLITEEFD